MSGIHHQPEPERQTDLADMEGPARTLIDTRSMEKKRTITLRQIGVMERISRAGVTITWEDGERDTIPLDHLPAECVCHPRGQRVEAIVQRAESSFEVLKVLYAQTLPPLARKTEPEANALWNSVPGASTRPAESWD